MGPRTRTMLICALDMLEKSLKREMKTKRDNGRSIQAEGIQKELDDLHTTRRIVADMPVDIEKADNHVSLPLSPSTVKNK